jgi:glycerol-1-phosphate dehydrogenase [NAD(P)+]
VANIIHELQKLIMGKGVLPKITEIAEPFKEGPILMVSDNHTFQAAGEKVLGLLEQEQFPVKSLVLDSGDDILIPDEAVVGKVLLNIEPGTRLLIGVGSGSINDTVKYISSRTGIPYVIVCTAHL